MMCLAAIWLGFTSAALAAYDFPLDSESIREAYFLGRRNDEKTIKCLASYFKRLPLPEKGPHISEISLYTPYAQIVLNSSRNAGSPGVSPPLSWSTIGGTGICDRRVYPELKEFRRAAGGLLRERRADVRRQKENFRLSDLRESGVGPPISWPSTTARQALPTSRANAEAFRPASPIIAIFLPELLAALSREKTVLVRN